MGKKCRCEAAPIEEFKPFYKKDGLIWIPYRSSDDTWFLHYLRPETVWQGINFALPIVGNAGKIIPFALSALRGAGGNHN